MIGHETCQRIRLLAEGDRMSVTQIACEAGVSRPTVRKVLDNGKYVPRKYSPRSSKLDAFRETVKRHLDRHQYSSVQILRMIKEEGYAGGERAYCANTSPGYVRLCRPHI